MIKELLCNDRNTIYQALKIINNNSKGICFVVDYKNVLKGLVTDGDIRRSLLNGVQLDEKIKNILNNKFSFGNINESKNDLIKKINDKVKIIPLVNDNKIVKDFFEYKQDLHFPVAIPNLNGNEFKYLTDAFLSSWVSSSGEYLKKFEKEFSKYSDCKYGVACSNGTSAIHLALIALGIGGGDEVIVPDLAFAATINAVLHANATPVIVDIEEKSWCINYKEIEKAITAKTKAIIPVHIYGQPCDMDKIMKISKKYNLKVIEDCAEAHGAKFRNKKVGSFGDIGCYSFYGNKIITTGEGGMCVTNKLNLDKKMRLLRDHGMSKHKRYWHEIVGFNYRMTNLQAAIGLAQLERIDEIHKKKNKYEKIYRKFLPKKIFNFQKNLKSRKRVTWLACILINKKFNREKHIKKFINKGIDARNFFYPLSDMKIYKKYCKQKTPISHDVSKRGFNLPTYESLKSLEEIKTILTKL
jgi:perosamine synthetase